MPKIEINGQIRDIPEYCGYAVTDQGQVLSRWIAQYLQSDFQRVLKPHKDRDGYLKVRLNRPYSIGVHRLVLLAFVGPCPVGMEACHRNGDPGDNRLDNLRWDTHKSNVEDRRHYGRVIRFPGESNPAAKLNAEKVRQIRALYEGGDVTYKELAAQFGVNKSLISLIVRRLSWSHV